MSKVSPRRVRYLADKTAACEAVVHEHTRHQYPHPCGGVDIRKLLQVHDEVVESLSLLSGNDQAKAKVLTLVDLKTRLQALATEVDAAYAVARRQPGLYGQVPTQRTRLQVYVRDSFTCVYCGQDYDLTVDHVIPVSKGGLSNPENLVAACRLCNQAKADKLLHHTEVPLALTLVE